MSLLINPLVSEIKRGLWAIDVNNIEAYFRIAQKIISGETVDFGGTKDVKALLGTISSNGVVRRPDGDDVLDVEPNSIAHVSMIGEVIKYGDYCVYGADDIVHALQEADDNPNFDFTIFNIDGPGGSVAAIDVFRDFKSRKKKPIIGHITGDALSLHYWGPVEVCDWLIVYGTVSCRIGSIGVFASWMDYSEYLKNEGIEQVEVYPDESKHKNDAMRLAREGKFELIKTEHLSPLAIKFQESVKAARPNLLNEVGVLTGKTFYAEEALRIGLIDEIGDIHAAIKKGRELAITQGVSKLNQ